MPEGADTGWYVYGVVHAPFASLPDVSGMDGHALQVVEHEGLGAVVTEIVLPRPPGRRRDLLSHSDVLNAICQTQDVVPMRVGTVAPDEHAVVTEVLAPEQAGLEALLAGLAGAVQLNLRVSYVEERVLGELVARDPAIRDLHHRTRSLPAEMPHPDLVALGRLVADRMAAVRHEDSAVLLESVLPLVRDTRLRDRGGVDHVVDVALLVDRESVGLVESHLEALARDVRERMLLQLVGPLAPFDFAEVASWA